MSRARMLRNGFSWLLAILLALLLLAWAIGSLIVWAAPAGGV